MASFLLLAPVSRPYKPSVYIKSFSLCLISYVGQNRVVPRNFIAVLRHHSIATKDDLDSFIVISMKSQVCNLSGTTMVICRHLTSIKTYLTAQNKWRERQVFQKPLSNLCHFQAAIKGKNGKIHLRDITQRSEEIHLAC